jgi:hypothetical protein
MRIQAWAAAAAILGSSALAGEVTPTLKRTVTACMHSGADLLAGHMAQVEVSKIFAKIEIQIVWRDPRGCAGDDGTVIISFLNKTPVSDHPDAWAYALPYELTHIVVFYDRIQETVGPSGAPHLLAYVVAHEITHILQGVSRHSDTGIMKAFWNSEDIFEMGRGSLGFAPSDVYILYHNMDKRDALFARITATNEK